MHLAVGGPAAPGDNGDWQEAIEIPPGGMPLGERPVQEVLTAPVTLGTSVQLQPAEKTAWRQARLSLRRHYGTFCCAEGAMPGPTACALQGNFLNNMG